MSKVVSFVIVGLVALFLFASSVSAAFTVSNVPASTTSDQEFQVTVSLSVAGSAGNTYYLRAAFAHPDTSSSYFGYTKDNVGTWYNGTPSIDHTKFYQITMDSSGAWNGTVSVKPDPTSSSFKGSGNYTFKMGRYTAAGSGPAWSDEAATIAVSAPPTPTPTPTATATPTPTPAPSSTPTPTQKPTATPTSTPTLKPTATPTQRATPTPVEERGEFVLGEQATGNTPTPEAGTSSVQARDWKTLIFSATLIISGLSFLGFSAYSFFRKSPKFGRINDSEVP